MMSPVPPNALLTSARNAATLERSNSPLRTKHTAPFSLCDTQRKKLLGIPAPRMIGRAVGCGMPRGLVTNEYTGRSGGIHGIKGRLANWRVRWYLAHRKLQANRCSWNSYHTDKTKDAIRRPLSRPRRAATYLT